ncbi:MAG: DNA polymerase I [Chloroflexi bacterium]|nr:DNA polymerase I [Chloroflexota bacterium]
MAERVLLLIDGHALVYRGFYALQETRPFTNAKGELTTGVYAFTSMLLKALEDLKPQYASAAFDMSRPTFRLKEFAAYKGTRTAAPPGLRDQVTWSRRVLEAMQVPLFEVEGYEADDVIGALSVKAVEQGLNVIILSGDNDLLQLVNPHVKVLTSRRGISDTILYDEAKVIEKYGGLRPDQVPDFKALRGDVTDNIPGVAGIGDKGASKLLVEFGSAQALFDNLDSDNIPAKQRDLLAPLRDQVLLARKLATIVTDLPVALDLEKARLRDLRRPEVIGIFQELSFKSLIDRIPKLQPPPLPKNGRAQAGLFDSLNPSEPMMGSPVGPSVTTLNELDELIRRVREHGSFAFNVQATGVLPMRADVVGIGLAAGAYAAYVPLGHVQGEQIDGDAALERLRPLFADAGVPKRAHNAKFHIVLLARHGVPVNGLAFDTMIAAFLLESGQRTLALRDLAWSKVQVELPSVQSLLGIGRKAITMAELSIADCGSYACQEALLVERIVAILEEELELARQTALFRDVEMPLVPVLADMEMAGIAVDLPYLAELGIELEARIGSLEADIYGHVGHEFNINSTQLLSQVLFGELHLEIDKRKRRSKTKTGHISTGSDVLEELRGTHPIIDLILEHRQLQKLKGTYVDALQQLIDPNTGRVHTSFNQTGAATGRLSSSDPNLQNIPIRTDTGKRVRRAFIARPGARLLSADYSQIELRVLAHLANEPTLRDAFAKGEDPHAVTAAEVLGIPLESVTADHRRVAKMINFGVLYGMSDYGLAERTGLPAADASAFIQRYFQRFGTVKAYQDGVIRDAENKGYAETMLGRRRYLPEINSHLFAVRSAAIRQIINAPIQGSASDIVKIAMIRMSEFLMREAPEVRMLVQVHDELLLEGPEDELRRIAPDLCDIMVDAYDMKARLHVDLKMGPNWEDMRRLIVRGDDSVALGDLVATEEEDADLVPDALQSA